MGSSRRLGILVIAIALAAPSARADDAAVARDAYDKGMAHYHLEEYDAAITEWERGFRAKPAPEFLYNIAQAYRLSQRPDKALSFYQKYLRMNPEAKNRAEVERHIAAMQDEIAKQPKKEEPAATPAPAPTPPPPTTATAPAPTTNALVASPPEKRPLYKKGWFWGVVAGAAVVAAGAVTLGVLYSTKSNVQTLADARF